MDFFTRLITDLTIWSKTNPVVAGLFGAWSLSVVTLLCRNVPTNLGKFVLRQMTTSLSLTNEALGRGLESFADFVDWFEKNAPLKYSRSIALYPTWGEKGIAIGLGEGRHFFRYKGKLFWLRLSRSTHGIQQQVIREVSITCFGRDRALMKSLIGEFIRQPSDDKVGIWAWHEGAWMLLSEVYPRPLMTVAVPQSIRVKVLQDIKDFKSDREWYASRGLSYKLTFVLHSPPGTGKSSFVKALASHLKMGLCVINISQMSDQSFLTAMARAPKNSIILIEDVDSASATKKRGGATVTYQSSNDSQSFLEDLKSLTLTGILNTLDGVLGLDDKIVFMTTNRINDLDEAITRKGRVDHTYEFGKLGWREIQQYVTAMYPDSGIRVPPNLLPVYGCDLHALHMEHRHDAKAFCGALARDPDYKAPAPGFIAQEVCKLPREYANTYTSQ